MYCFKCGKEISEKAVFCENCGTKIASEQKTADTSCPHYEAKAEEPKASPCKQDNKADRKPAFFALYGVLLIIQLVFAFLYLVAAISTFNVASILLAFLVSAVFIANAVIGLLQNKKQQNEYYSNPENIFNDPIINREQILNIIKYVEKLDKDNPDCPGDLDKSDSSNNSDI